jgi:nucleoside-diphosphate-sugar epimerase
LRLHCGDLRDAVALREVVRETAPEVVFHCATYGGFAQERELAATIETNFRGTVHLVEALAETDALLVNTGSSSEYGHKASPMTERDVPEPLTAYGVTKAAAALYCQAVGRAEGRRIVTLRLFSPYGPWDDPRRLIPSTIARCLRCEPLLLTGGTQVRDFVFIEDVLAAYDAAARLRDPRGVIVNVGSGSQRSVRDVVDAITRLCGYDGEPQWGAIEATQPETTRWQADVTLARELLGWEPVTPFETGLRRTLDWLREKGDIDA